MDKSFHRANLMTRPPETEFHFQDDDPHIKAKVPHRTDLLLEYQLRLNAAEISDEKADGLGEAWSIQRNRWLEHDLGLNAAIQRSERRNREIIVVSNAEGRVMAEIPAGLKPSAERRWLRHSLGLQDPTSVVEQGSGAMPGAMEYIDQTHSEKVGLFRGIVNRLVSREQRSSVDSEERQTVADKPRNWNRITRVVAGVAALAMAGVGGLVASGEHSSDAPRHAASVTGHAPETPAPPVVPVFPRHDKAVHEQRIVNATDTITIDGSRVQATLKEGGNPWQAAKDVLRAEGQNSDNAAIAHLVAETGISNYTAHHLPVGTVIHFR